MNINQQLHLKNIYKQIINAVTIEMETHLKFKDYTKKFKQKFKHSKPYWSEKLTHLWKEMNGKEQSYYKCKRIYNQKQYLKHEFSLTRCRFDKVLWCAERQYNKQFLNSLEVLNTTNPKDF